MQNMNESSPVQMADQNFFLKLPGKRRLFAVLLGTTAAVVVSNTDQRIIHTYF